MAKTKLDIPGTDEIILEAVRKIEAKDPEKLQASYIEKNFSEVCELIFYEAKKIYINYEKRVLDGLHKSILNNDKQTFTRDEVNSLLKQATHNAASFEKSLRQGRSSRAGKAFESIVMQLFDKIGIPNEHITREDKKTDLRRIDIVVPDRKTAAEDPFNAQFLSLKTSLKDRWKLVSEDRMEGQRTHLLTLLQNEKLSNQVAEKLEAKKILLYVPDKVKEEQFPNKEWIKKLSDLPSILKKA